MKYESSFDGESRFRSIFNLALSKVNWIFFVCVVIPFVGSVFYFGLIASDVYISESRFVVRSPDKQGSSPLGAIFKSAGFTRAQDDTYIVQDFMISRDALRILNSQLDLALAFSGHDIDRFSRFNGFGMDNSFEALFRYYQSRVEVMLEDTSGISVLTVRAYSADDAWIINQKLLELGEGLVNQLNERARQDLISLSKDEVAKAEARAKAAALALSSFRNQRGVIDPERQSSLQLQSVAKLQDELIATRSRLLELRTVSPTNPQIPVLQQRVRSLETDIEEESAKITGGSRSLAGKAADYQRLVLENSFAERQLSVVLAALETANNEANRKQLYLERVVQPNKPDIALEPRRGRAILVSLILGLVSWGILSLLLAGVKEHRD